MRLYEMGAELRVESPDPLLRTYLRAIGLPLHVSFSIPKLEYEAALEEVQKQHPEETPEQQRARAIARVAFKHHGRTARGPALVAPLSRLEKAAVWAWRVLLLLAAWLIFGALVARAQVDVIRFEDSGGAQIKTFAAPFRFRCGTNTTCTASGNLLTITSSGGGGASHTILSATHTDTIPATVVRGDMIAGLGATPAWARIPISVVGRYWRSDGTEPGWSAVAAGGAGSCTNQFIRAANDNAAPTCASVSLTTDVTGVLPIANGGSAGSSHQTAEFHPKLPFRRSAVSFPSGSGTALQTWGDNFTVTGTGSQIAPNDTEGSALNAVSAGTTGSDVGAAGNLLWRHDRTAGERRDPYGFSEVALEEVTSVRAWVGFTNQTLTTMAGSDNPAGNYAAFRFSTDASETTWKCVTKDNTTQNVVDSTVTVTASQKYKLEIIFDDSVPNVTFKIDGVSRCSSPITVNLPTDGTNMRFCSPCGETRTGTARNFRSYRIYVQTNDP